MEIKYKKVLIGDLFEFPSTNSKITKKFCVEHPGDIPVYASSKNKKSVLGYIKDNLKGVSYYENCLSWNRNGSVGYVFLRDHKFSTNEDHRALVIKKEFIPLLDKIYLKFEIERKLMLNGFNFMNKCGVAKIKKIEIEIPCRNEKFNLVQQQKIAKKYTDIHNIRQKITTLYEEVEQLKVQVENEKTKKKVFLIEDIFKIKKGNSKYTKAYIRNNEGEFPVYSSQTTKEGIIGNIDSFDYDLECLTWTTDGIHAGTVFFRNGKFSMTTHCGVLIVRDEYKKLVSLRYLEYYLSMHLKDYATGEGNKRVTSNMISKIPIELPINEIGEIDLEKQKEIALENIKVKEIKNHLSELYENIMDCEVEI